MKEFMKKFLIIIIVIIALILLGSFTYRYLETDFTNKVSNQLNK